MVFLGFSQARKRPEPTKYRLLSLLMSTIYGIEHVPCNTHMRESIDPVSPESLRPVCKSVLGQLRCGKALAEMVSLDLHYLVLDFSLPFYGCSTLSSIRKLGGDGLCQYPRYMIYMIIVVGYLLRNEYKFTGEERPTELGDRIVNHVAKIEWLARTHQGEHDGKRNRSNFTVRHMEAAIVDQLPTVRLFWKLV